MQPELTTCRNCGNGFSGTYCNRCGEKVYTDHDRTLKHLLHDGFHFLTHFEGTFFTTLRAVFTRPGQLSLDYCNGVRKKYFRPMSLFLFSVIIYLLLTSLTNAFHGLNMQFDTYTNTEFRYWKMVQPVVEAKMKSTGMTMDALGEKYNSRSGGFSKVLLLVYLPLVALVLYLFYSRSRNYLFDHLIYATEFVSFFILSIFIFLQLLLLLLRVINKAMVTWVDDNSPFMLVVMGVVLLWVIVSSRRFYRQRLWVTVVKSIAFTWIFFFIITYIYNLILFYTVFLLIK